MHKAIRKIVGKIPSGMIFDSHFVIEQLIKKHSNAYLTFAASIGGAQKNTVSIHGQIGQEIERVCDDLVEKLDDAWSTNIHGTPSKCKAWRRL